MLKHFHTYCPFFVFLLLFSYGLSILHIPISNFYHEIAYTAQVQNSLFILDAQILHDHSQELAEINLELAKAQQEEQQEEQHQNIQKPKKDLKILNDIPCNKGINHLNTISNFKHHLSFSDAFQQLVLPPPRG